MNENASERVHSHSASMVKEECFIQSLGSLWDEVVLRESEMRREWMFIGLLVVMGCDEEASPGNNTPLLLPVDMMAVEADASFADLGMTMTDVGLVGDAAPLVVDQGLPQWPTGPSEDVCAEFPPTHTDFIDGNGDEFGEVAGDFSVTLIDGSTWQFSQAWTGCDSYVFFTYFNINSSIQEASQELWDSRLDELFSKGARNTRYFFMSDEPNLEDRTTRLRALQTKILSRLLRRFSDDADLLHWANRFHFITEQARDIEGGIGAFLNAYLTYSRQQSSGVDLGNRGIAYPPLPDAFGIDRNQRFDSVGSLSLAVGSPAALSMAGYVGGFYNHIAETAQNLAASPPEFTISLLEGTQTNRHFNLPIIFDDGIEWDRLTQVELDIQVHCPAKNPFACSEWDRIGRVELCRDQACTQVDEIARWITPYWRRGTRRWLIDISAFTPLLRASNLVIEPELGDMETPGAGGMGGMDGSAGAPSGDEPAEPEGARNDSCGDQMQGLTPVDCTALGDVNAFCVFSNHCLCSTGFVCEVSGVSGECAPGQRCEPETSGAGGLSDMAGAAGSDDAAGSDGSAGAAAAAGQNGDSGADGAGEGGAGDAGEGGAGSDGGNAGLAGAAGAGGTADEAGGGLAGAAGVVGTAGDSGMAGVGGADDDTDDEGVMGPAFPENARIIRLKMGPSWERKTQRDVVVNLHFRQSPKRIPQMVVPLFRGGGFNAEFDSNREPVLVELPESIEAAEIRYILSGHGQDGPNACSEWCAHKHQFIVNGTVNLVQPTTPRMTSLGCAEMTNEGVVPGQWGNWNQGRAYWCPGLPVPAVAIDVLSQLNVGASNTFEHKANTVSGSLSGGNIDLSSYLVIY